MPPVAALTPHILSDRDVSNETESTLSYVPSRRFTHPRTTSSCVSQSASALALRDGNPTIPSFILNASRITPHFTRKKGWIVDSGCTRHTTNDYSLLQNPTAERVAVNLAGKNSKIYTTARGSVGILSDVQCCPSCIANVFSVYVAAKKGFTTTFSLDGVVIKDPQDRTILHGKLHDGLYFFETDQLVKSTPSCSIHR